MMCPVCGKDTAVKDTRPTDRNTIKRRRVCENGHKFNTWESTTNAAALIESRKEALRRFKARLSPEERAARNKRDHMRRAARVEARQTGEPVEVIYQRWGVAA